MKIKLIFCLTLVLNLFCSRITAQSAFQTNQWRDHFFPVLPRITNADPAITHPVSILVPTKLKIKRTTDTLAVTIDTNDLEFTNIIVGTNMVTGFHGQLFIYPIGESKPTHWNRMLEVGRNYDWGMGTSLFHTKADGIPQSNKSYVVEMELSAFETDMPPQHNCSPYGKNYKIIWQRNLKQIVK